MKALFKFSVLLILLAGCKRDKVDFIGPAYISAPSGFEVMSFTSSLSSVDFTVDSVFLNATFSHEVTWKLTITGKKSGAVEEISGTSKGFSNLKWNGCHTGVYFFKTDENAIATLSFFGTDLKPSLNINILAERDFSTYGQFPFFGDFENEAGIQQNSIWYAFSNPITPIPNVKQGVDSIAIDYNGNLVPTVQGKNYYFIKGKGDQPAFVSGIRYDKAQKLISPVLTATPDNIWVNVYIYGTGDANASVEIEYQEAHMNGPVPVYDQEIDDAFVAYVTLSHKGWKLFSFKYSDLTPSLNAKFGGSGNKIHEPQLLKAFDLILVKKSNPDSPVELYFDYPIITVGGPFNPSK